MHNDNEIYNVREFTVLVAINGLEVGHVDDSEGFYAVLQRAINNININDNVIIAGDLYAQIGDSPIKNVMGDRETLNKNGRLLIDFSAFNNFKITNMFFHIKMHINILGMLEALSQYLIISGK